MKRISDRLKREVRLLMPRNFKLRADSVIGLDLGHRCFRAVKIQRKGKDISVVNSLVGEVTRIKELGKDIYAGPYEPVCINSARDNVIVRRIDIPVMPHGEIEEALRWELKTQVPFNIDEARVRFDIIGERDTEEGSRRIELLAVVYREKDVADRIDELRDLGLNIYGIFPPEIALFNYLRHLGKISPRDTVGIVDIGSTNTSVSIIKDGQLCFVRNISLGSDAITDAMTGSLRTDTGLFELSREEAEKIKCEQGISQDIKLLSMMRPVLERLASQIKRSLEYCEESYYCEVIKKIILAGNGSRLRGLKEYLFSQAGLEVVDILPEIACAQGLGLALVDNSGLNMLPDKIRTEKRSFLKRVSAGLILSVFIFLFLSSYIFLSVRINYLKNGIEVLKSEWKNMSEVRALRDKILILNSTLEDISSRRLDVVRVMRELSNIMPSFVELDKMVIRDREPNLTLSGIIKGTDRLSEFMSELENSPVFEKVKLLYSKKDSAHTKEQVLNFEIVCNVSLI